MERIYQKIGRINEYLDLLRSFQEDCLARFQADPLYRGALLHYLYLLLLAAQAFFSGKSERILEKRLTYQKFRVNFNQTRL